MLESEKVDLDSKLKRITMELEMKYSSQLASLEAMVKSLQAEINKLKLYIKELESRKPEKEV